VENPNSFMQDVRDNTRRHGPSELKHMQSASKAWKLFLENMKNPVVLDGNLVKTEYILAFIQYCLIDEDGYPRLSFYTVRDTYFRSLLKWFKKQGWQYEEDIRKLVLLKCKQLLANKRISEAQMPQEIGAAPICLFDWDLMAASYPMGAEDVLEMKALGSLLCNTGVRGVTIQHFRWEHFKGVKCFKNGLVQIKFIFTHQKGDSSWNKNVTLEGRVDDTRGRNFVYHFQQYIRECLGDWRADLNSYSRLRGRGEVFPKSTDSYSARFKAISRYTGYPEKLKHSLHSFRPGFLTNCMLQAAAKGKPWLEAWTQAAHLQGWSLSNDKNQRKYVKAGFQQCVVSNRAYGGGALEDPTEEVQEFFGKGIVAQNMLNPKDFHNLSEAPKSCWPEQQQHRHFVLKLADVIAAAYTGNPAKLSFTGLSNQAYKFICDKYVGKVEPNAKKRYETPRRDAVRKWIREKAQTDPTHEFRRNVEEVVEEVRQHLRANVRKGYKNKGDWYKNRKVARPKPAPVRKKGPTDQRTRQRWTDEEIRTVMKKYLEIGPAWAQICLDPVLHLRTNVDCSNMFRNRKKAYPELEKGTEVAEAWLRDHPDD